MFSYQIPPFEVELILAHILKKSREYVLMHPELILTKAQKRQFEKLIKRRKACEPLAHILGHKEFYGLDFKVNKNVIIPRPETEMLVEEILRLKPKNKNIIDIGTGSGNIIIALAKNIKEKNNYFGIDISEKALSVTRFNARKHNVDKKIRFVKSDLLKTFIQNTRYKIPDTELIIVANLPYLSEIIYSSTMPDVKNFEPKSALLSGPDGLAHYERLLKQIKLLSVHCSLSTVHCFLEISPEQKPKIGKIIRRYFPKSKTIFKKDLAGKWRVVSFEI
jgi:release factor glutamine methyltransferase